MEHDPNEFNLRRSDLEAPGTRAWDSRRLPRQSTQCIWSEANTTAELVQASGGSEVRMLRGVDGVVVTDVDGNRLGAVPAHRLLAPDWPHVIARLHWLASGAETEEQRRTLHGAIRTIETEPWEVIDRPCWDVVVVPVGERDAIVLARPFVVPEWPASDAMRFDGVYVVDLWNFPAVVGTAVNAP